MATVSLSYTATSPADIAASFHVKSKEVEKIANLPGRSKKDYDLQLREADVWRQAAEILEKTTIINSTEER